MTFALAGWLAAAKRRPSPIVIAIHSFPCRMDCFSTNTFRQCLQSLLLDEDSNTYLEMVEIIGKKRRR